MVTVYHVCFALVSDIGRVSRVSYTNILWLSMQRMDTTLFQNTIHLIHLISNRMSNAKQSVMIYVPYLRSTLFEILLGELEIR